MKKLAVSVIALITFVTFKTTALGSTNAGPMDVKLTVITQDSSVFDPFSSKTNSTATSTNITTTGKSTLIKTKFGSADLLALMANSFNTNFPPGSQVGFILGGAVCVVDSTGTNVIFAPSPPATIAFSGVISPTVQSGSQVVTTTIDASGTTVSGYGNAVSISLATLHYDDTAFTTADGTPTVFTFTGEYNQTNTRAKGKDFIVITGQLQGAGDGTLRGQAAVLTGTFQIKPFQVPPAD